MHEELGSRLSEQLNQRMYLLSAIAAIFLPLSLITGLLGINVGGLPGANSEIAFLVVSLLLVAMGLGLAWLLRRLRFF
jgi:zinc transporter